MRECAEVASIYHNYRENRIDRIVSDRTPCMSKQHSHKMQTTIESDDSEEYFDAEDSTPNRLLKYA